MRCPATTGQSDTKPRHRHKLATSTKQVLSATKTSNENVHVVNIVVYVQLTMVRSTFEYDHDEYRV